MSQPTPPGFPANIPVSPQDYENWSREINVPNLWTCAPLSADEVVQVCNWAKDNGYRVRPRGIAHGWSPLTVTNQTSQTSQTPTENVVLVDLTQSPALCSMELVPAAGNQSARVKVGAGATMIDLLTFLEGAPGGQGDAPGYSFPHTPAPGHLTVGGALAIGAHGTAIPSAGEAFNASYGSLSNQIVEFTAVVFDQAAGQYAAVTFKRGQGDDKAFLVHAGRAFLLDATLQVIDNYNLRCQSFMDSAHSWEVLFKPPAAGATAPSQNSFAYFLEQSGRIEVIWFPFSENPWLKVWTHAAQKPEAPSVVVVTGPNNYVFSDDLPDFVTDFFKLLLGVPTTTTVGELILEILKWLLEQATALKGDDSEEAKQLAASLHDLSGALTKQVAMTATGHAGHGGLTPYVGWLMAFISAVNLYRYKVTDLWGPSKDTLLYVQDTTLRVTANGYAVHLRRADVQQAVSDFANQFTTMLQKYQADGEFPINSPLEIRVTALDDPSKVSVDPGMTAQGPVISALSMDGTDVQNGWDTALWLDVLTLPGTPSSSAFYAELEAWFLQRFSGTAGRVLPEWSKGWAYTADEGAWTNADVMQTFRQTLTAGRAEDDNWNWEVATLKKYDPHNIFSNSFLDQLMTPV